MSVLPTGISNPVADQRAEALLRELGGDAAVQLIAEKTILFLQSGSEAREELRMQIAKLTLLNETAKQYLLARFNDLEPLQNLQAP